MAAPVRWKRPVAKLVALFARRKPADDLDEEIRAHLRMEEQEILESGVAPDEAHYAALCRFGNVTLAQERNREMWGWSSVETLWQDICYGMRVLPSDSITTADSLTARDNYWRPTRWSTSNSSRASYASLKEQLAYRGMALTQVPQP